MSALASDLLEAITPIPKRAASARSSDEFWHVWCFCPDQIANRLVVAECDAARDTALLTDLSTTATMSMRPMGW
jgi:hypothetical protein